MPAESAEFPGRQRRERKDGSIVYYWVALPKAIGVGFLPKTERLPDADDEMSRRCIELQAQMDRWLADPTRQDRLDPKLVKTIRDLIRLYMTEPDSPYSEVGKTSRGTYDRLCAQLDRTEGERRLTYLNGKDFRRWYNEFKRSRSESGTERLGAAFNRITMLRTLLSFGVQWGVPDAPRLRNILHEMRFRNLPAREEQVTYKMAVSFIAKAHELGEHAMAFAQALQFDLMLRQTDVIGKWEPRDDDPTKLEWVPGILWQHINSELIMTYTPGKTENTTNQKVVFDLNEYELVMAEIDRLHVVPNIGPMIVNPSTGLPYKYNAYAVRWRELARLAGIPDEVCNRDSRAGGVTEGADAGADIEDLRQHAGHKRTATTQRYSRRTVEKATRVQRLRRQFRVARAKTKKN